MEPELHSPFWRLNHLYSCKREGTGESVPFRMRPEQEQVLQSLYDEPMMPVYIIKARRLGLSTGIGIGMQDFASWNGGSQTKVIERNQAEAMSKMKTILRFSFESQPREILDRFEVVRRSDSALSVKVRGLGDQFLSSTEAVITARGGDCSWLWVSEGAIIAHRDPPRMEEIVTGAWPGARLGRRVQETTWMGGKGGLLWALIKPIMERNPDAEGKLMFFPWHNDPVCFHHDGGPISKDHEEYFTSLGERLGKKFTREQKRWYVVTSKTQGIFMKREYPSTLDEALSAPVEGAIYAREIGQAQAEGRIGTMPIDSRSLVHTSWDLGSPENMVVWYWQVVGRTIRVIDVDHGLSLTLTARVAHMLAKGYEFGYHYLPHDAQSRNATGLSMEQEIIRAGLPNLRVVRNRLSYPSSRGRGARRGWGHEATDDERGPTAGQGVR